MLQIFAQALLIATRQDVTPPYVTRRPDPRDVGGTRRKPPLNG
jgi:hypothetical protein